MILLWGFIVIGLIELQRMDYARRSSDARLEIAKRSGEVSIQNQAARLGYGRYQDERFVWNTNLFDNISMAIGTVVESEKNTAAMANTCLRMAQVTLQAGELMKKLDNGGIKVEDSNQE